MPYPTPLPFAFRLSAGGLRATALAALLALSACGGGGGDNAPYAVPSAPAGLGYADTAPAPQALAFVDLAATNQRGDARYATLDTNAGVRVLSRFLEVWEPSTRLVDAGATAPARDGFPAVAASAWRGIPGDATDGTVKNAAVHRENIDYVVRATAARTAAQERAAYLDDRRGKNYSTTDGLGPLTDAWRRAARQTTTITGMPADAATVAYDDGGNNTGVAGDANPEFGRAIAFVQSMGNNASTEPAKRFYKYARPWRWSSGVRVVPALESAKSGAPATDGGFPSGHSAEAVRNAVGMAYLVPERFQEMLARGLELGENRIVAGMHSPLDVIGGRILGQASAIGNIAATAPEARAAAREQAQKTLMAAVGAGTPEQFLAYAHAQTTAQDRFADAATNRTEYRRRSVFGFGQAGDATRPAVVPKGAEVVLETRLPYLSDAQRRVVLKSTALPSGYPVLDDAEGYGRLNLLAAGDGYGSFQGDVAVTMDAQRGGFHARDTWRNDIAGAGKLTKQGSGSLALAGANAYTGGTEVAAGTLQAASASALGRGPVYIGGGTLATWADSALRLGGSYTQTAAGTWNARIGANGAGQVAADGTAALAGTLTISFAQGYVPKAGDTVTVMTAGRVVGRFDTVSASGFKAVPIYGSDRVQVQLVALD
jgi:autotransporter-associated beta strand protein